MTKRKEAVVATSGETVHSLNRTHLDQIHNATVDQLDAITLDEIFLLREDLEAEKTALARHTAAFAHLMGHRFSLMAANAYHAAEKDTGKLRIGIDARYELVIDRRKIVAWDQDKLATLFSRIEQHGDDPAVYIQRVVSTSYKVSEAAYKTWPEAVQGAFVPARTVKAGELQFSIEPKEPEHHD